jgi:hypothetical protein
MATGRFVSVDKPLHPDCLESVASLPSLFSFNKDTMPRFDSRWSLSLRFILIMTMTTLPVHAGTADSSDRVLCLGSFLASGLGLSVCLLFFLI